MSQIPEPPGRWTILRTTPARATALAEEAFEGPIDGHLPDLEEGFLAAHHLVQQFGRFGRAEMPVTDDADVPHIQRLLADMGHHSRTHSITAGHLVPLQREIWVDKVLGYIAQRGVEQCLGQITHGHIILSRNHAILDGHHRWLGAMMMSVHARIRALVVDLDHHRLLDALRVISDMEGNARNP